MFEYEVIPAPRKGKKARGVKSSEARFALAMTDLLNDMAADGWEYQRTDTLPSEERAGLTGRSTTYQNMLVFRRPLDHASPEVELSPTPALDARSKVEEPNTAPALPSADQANQVGDSAPNITRDEA
ncbi:DUF4177 domain-containing protein [uncultured Aliiroseovarius sp.]|uniref:DUF4177 domain-containing protein n=1 Tax=uncultured Aliiroseovarius sp. TaxID=1658783 RepID=UPI002591CB4C|nr:DUF4177 domain-containing protein [uncultured Aliiroseovarius sp.]